MNRAPAVGDRVQCPPDRGDAGYPGVIEHVWHEVNRLPDGTAYQWVTVRRTQAPCTAHVWPSNRLGYRF